VCFYILKNPIKGRGILSLHNFKNLLTLKNPLIITKNPRNTSVIKRTPSNGVSPLAKLIP
jgi:hypothetical protein